MVLKEVNSSIIGGTTRNHQSGILLLSSAEVSNMLPAVEMIVRGGTLRFMIDTIFSPLLICRCTFNLLNPIFLLLIFHSLSIQTNPKREDGSNMSDQILDICH